jgi:excisionase family DNA binding protein
MEPRLMHSRTETAQLLGVSIRLIDQAIAAGTLEVRRIGRRVLIPHGAIERFIENSNVNWNATPPTRPKRQTAHGSGEAR